MDLIISRHGIIINIHGNGHGRGGRGFQESFAEGRVNRAGVDRRGCVVVMVRRMMRSVVNHSRAVVNAMVKAVVGHVESGMIGRVESAVVGRVESAVVGRVESIPMIGRVESIPMVASTGMSPSILDLGQMRRSMLGIVIQLERGSGGETKLFNGFEKGRPIVSNDAQGSEGGFIGLQEGETGDLFVQEGESIGRKVGRL